VAKYLICVQSVTHLAILPPLIPCTYYCRSRGSPPFNKSCPTAPHHPCGRRRRNSNARQPFSKSSSPLFCYGVFNWDWAFQNQMHEVPARCWQFKQWGVCIAAERGWPLGNIFIQFVWTSKWPHVFCDRIYRQSRPCATNGAGSRKSKPCVFVLRTEHFVAQVEPVR